MKGFFLPGLQNVCKISLTCANCPLSSIFHWYIGKTSQVSKIFQTFLRVGQENPHMSVKSSKQCWEHVRKNLPTDWAKNNKPAIRAWLDQWKPAPQVFTDPPSLCWQVYTKPSNFLCQSLKVIPLITSYLQMTIWTWQNCTSVLSLNLYYRTFFFSSNSRHRCTWYHKSIQIEPAVCILSFDNTWPRVVGSLKDWRLAVPANI